MFARMVIGETVGAAPPNPPAAFTSPVCPGCDSKEFKCQQWTWNEQSFSVNSSGGLDWGLSDNYDHECERVVAIVCGACKEDCTALFTDRIQICAQPDWKEI